MAESFKVLLNAGILSAAICERMQKATGLRNPLVLEYQKINWAIIWQVLSKHPSDPIDFTDEIYTWLSKQQQK